jgi:hypothetical protein
MGKREEALNNYQTALKLRKNLLESGVVPAPLQPSAT